MNTLIDLTAVATSTGTQQLRGAPCVSTPHGRRRWRTTGRWRASSPRPSTWTAPPRRSACDDDTDTSLGLSADDGTRIVSGLDHALPSAAIAALDAVLEKVPGATIERINEETLSRLPTRARTRADWRIGEPHDSRERDVVSVRTTPEARLLRTGPTLAAAVPLTFGFSATGIALGTAALGAIGAVSLPLEAGVTVAALGGVLATAVVCGSSVLRALHRLRDPAALYGGAALAIARSLHDAGRVGPFDASTVRVRNRSAADFWIEIAGPRSDRALIADALQELFAVAESPRFLLRVDQGIFGRPGPVLDRIRSIVDRAVPGRRLLPVPAALSRRRADAEAFAARWRETVGQCELHELRGRRVSRCSRSPASPLRCSTPRSRGTGSGADGRPCRPRRPASPTWSRRPCGAYDRCTRIVAPDERERMPENAP